MSAKTLGVRGIIGSFYQKLEALTAESWAGPLSMFIKSDQETETYKWLGMAPGMREWIGGREAKGFRDNGITVTNRLFEGTLEVPYDDIRRDKTGQMQVRIGELAGRAAELWADLLTALITDNGTCYDTHDFFSATHLEGSSGTQLNLLTASQVTALNIGTATVPTDAEMSAAIMGVIQYMMSYRDDQGKQMNAHAKKWLLMVPWNLYGAATAAVNAKLIAAAPELLEACTIIIRKAADLGIDPVDFKIMHSAIKKATS